MATPVMEKSDKAPEPGFADSPYITVTFRVRRFNPEVAADATWEDFQLEIDPKERVLDALHKIKWDLDGSLTFRRSCAHGICGSDAMRINGKNRLACKTLIKDLSPEKPITVEPIKGLTVLKDLVVDMEPFFQASAGTIADTRGIFEALSTKLGVVLLVLGVMHLGNVYVLNKIRRRGLMEREQLPRPAAGLGGPDGRGLTRWLPLPGRRPAPRGRAHRPLRRRVRPVRPRAGLAAAPAPAGAAGAGPGRVRRGPPALRGLDHGSTLDEVAAVGDAGQVYRGAAAWVVVLWALRGYRGLAHRLSTPKGALLARGAVLAAAKWRAGQRQWGGDGYRRADIERGGAKRLGEGRWSSGGWAYEPGLGWIYTGPGCDDGTCATG
ncbi:hypothetical protein STENM223S_05180 [Streptomyces tendae]